MMDFLSVELNKMKFITKRGLLMVWTAVFAVLFIGVFAACSDDDGDELSAPKYRSLSAKYLVENDSVYESVELSEGGNYVITLHSTSSALSKGKYGETVMARLMFPPSARHLATRTAADGIFFGKYSVTSDGMYQLEGFGTLTFLGNGNEQNSLKIVPAGGAVANLKVQKATGIADCSIVRKLCRTWDVVRIEEKEYVDGKLYVSISYDGATGKISCDNPLVDLPQASFAGKVLFTRAGTYLNCYHDGRVVAGNWKMKSRSPNSIYWTLTPGQWDEDGWALVSFSKGSLTTTQNTLYSVNDHTYRMVSVALLSEARVY